MDAIITKTPQQSYCQEMQQQGVLVLRNKIDAPTIALLIYEINKISKIVMAKINAMERPIKTYSDIAERQLGRLDFRCGFSAPLFKEVEKPIISLIKTLSPKIDFRHYWGAIPAQANAGPTDMHRDVFPFFNTDKGNDLQALQIELPPFYFTVLIPLVEITEANGPTEFIKGSNRQTIIDEEHAEIFAPLLSPGDIIIFEGRTMHRGSANKTNQERLIAYITFIANWYYDQTFVMNDYLFPELLKRNV